MCTKFNALQTEIANLFQVERKKFFIIHHVDTPQKKFKFKNPESTVKPKHFQKNDSKHHSVILQIFCAYKLLIPLQLCRVPEHDYCNCIVVLYICFSSPRKKTQASAWVKSSKVMPQVPHYLSFLLGKGGKLLHLNPSKNCKTSQSALSDHKSL